MSDEELDELERELDESLGDFDEEINRQQTYAEERANESSGEDGLGGVGAFEEYTEEADGNAKGKGKSPTVASSSGETESDGSSSSSSSGAGGASSDNNASVNREGSDPEQDSDAQDSDTGEEQEPDRPDLRKNDDIVARQIREAAEQETDPELKKKLWEEYYNYKGR